MAGELQMSYEAGAQVYYLIRNRSAQIWNGSAFVTYVSLNYATYDIAAAEQGTVSAYYVADFPAAITTPGVYSVVGKRQLGGSPAETDPSIGQEDFDWNGVAPAALTDLPTSGHLGNYLPIRLYRGSMIQNFRFKLVSAADHITPFTSGIVSGQIGRDGGAFTVLQSGAFTEVGLGHYALQALTSGDLLCNTASLVFSAVGISGGNADQRDFALVLQRSSGQ
jgi:hypothetical protein